MKHLTLPEVRDIVAKYSPEYLAAVSSPWGEWPQGQVAAELKICLKGVEDRFESWGFNEGVEECKNAIIAIEREGKEKKPRSSESSSYME